MNSYFFNDICYIYYICMYNICNNNIIYIYIKSGILFNRETPETLPLKLGRKQGCSSPPLFLTL